MSDMQSQNQDEFRIFKSDCGSCAFIDNSCIFAFAVEGAVDDYIKSKEFVAFEDFIKKRVKLW